MALVPAGKYTPLFRGEKDAKEIAVAPFLLDERPVTNGEFLAFVRENPRWQRSQVKRLFADERYLAHWGGDLDLGKADAAQPVTCVSWFAAKSFAAWRGRRLPTTVEWEFAAGAGFTNADGAKDTANFPAFMLFGMLSSLKAGYTVHNLGFRFAKDPGKTFNIQH